MGGSGYADNWRQVFIGLYPNRRDRKEVFQTALFAELKHEIAHSEERAAVESRKVK